MCIICIYLYFLRLSFVYPLYFYAMLFNIYKLFTILPFVSLIVSLLFSNPQEHGRNLRNDEMNLMVCCDLKTV